MRRITTRAGDLDVNLLGEGDDLLVVLCHGFGAPGTDLVPLAAELVALSPRLGAHRFAFPTAPIDLSPMGLWGGRAWFPIDLAALDAANRQGRADVLAAAEPPGMALARRKLRAAIEVLMGSRPWSRVVLGGFSQGAMMALDLALRLEEAPAAVLAFSPTLVDRASWARGAALRRGLPVVISHGRQDPLLPIAATESLAGLLREHALEVDYVPFEGPHTIPFEALTHAAELLSRLGRLEAATTSNDT